MPEDYKPSSVTIQDRLEQRIEDLEHENNELKALIRYWDRTMNLYVPIPWSTFQRFGEIRKHIDRLGLSGNGMKPNVQTEPLSNSHPEANQDKPE